MHGFSLKKLISILIIQLFLCSNICYGSDINTITTDSITNHYKYVLKQGRQFLGLSSSSSESPQLKYFKSEISKYPVNSYAAAMRPRMLTNETFRQAAAKKKKTSARTFLSIALLAIASFTALYFLKTGGDATEALKWLTDASQSLGAHLGITENAAGNLVSLGDESLQVTKDGFKTAVFALGTVGINKNKKTSLVKATGLDRLMKVAFPAALLIVASYFAHEFSHYVIQGLLTGDWNALVVRDGTMGIIKSAKLVAGSVAEAVVGFCGPLTNYMFSFGFLYAGRKLLASKRLSFLSRALIIGSVISYLLWGADISTLGFFGRDLDVVPMSNLLGVWRFAIIPVVVLAYPAAWRYLSVGNKKTKTETPGSEGDVKFAQKAFLDTELKEIAEANGFADRVFAVVNNEKSGQKGMLVRRFDDVTKKPLYGLDLWIDGRKVEGAGLNIAVSRHSTKEGKEYLMIEWVDLGSELEDIEGMGWGQAIVDVFFREALEQGVLVRNLSTLNPRMFHIYEKTAAKYGMDMKVRVQNDKFLPRKAVSILKKMMHRGYIEIKNRFGDEHVYIKCRIEDDNGVLKLISNTEHPFIHPYIDGDSVKVRVGDNKDGIRANDIEIEYPVSIQFIADKQPPSRLFNIRSLFKVFIATLFLPKFLLAGIDPTPHPPMPPPLADSLGVTQGITENVLTSFDTALIVGMLLLITSACFALANVFRNRMHQETDKEGITFFTVTKNLKKLVVEYLKSGGSVQDINILGRMAEVDEEVPDTGLRPHKKIVEAYKSFIKRGRMAGLVVLGGLGGALLFSMAQLVLKDIGFSEGQALFKSIITVAGLMVSGKIMAGSFSAKRTLRSRILRAAVSILVIAGLLVMWSGGFDAAISALGDTNITSGISGAAVVGSVATTDSRSSLQAEQNMALLSEIGLQHPEDYPHLLANPRVRAFVSDAREMGLLGNIVEAAPQPSLSHGKIAQRFFTVRNMTVVMMLVGILLSTVDSVSVLSLKDLIGDIGYSDADISNLEALDLVSYGNIFGVVSAGILLAGAYQFCVQAMWVLGLPAFFSMDRVSRREFYKEYFKIKDPVKRAQYMLDDMLKQARADGRTEVVETLESVKGFYLNKEDPWGGFVRHIPQGLLYISEHLVKQPETLRYFIMRRARGNYLLGNREWRQTEHTYFGDFAVDITNFCIKYGNMPLYDIANGFILNHVERLFARRNYINRVGVLDTYSDLRFFGKKNKSYRDTKLVTVSRAKVIAEHYLVVGAPLTPFIFAEECYMSEELAAEILEEVYLDYGDVFAKDVTNGGETVYHINFHKGLSEGEVFEFEGQEPISEPVDYNGEVIVAGGSYEGFAALKEFVSGLPSEHPPVVYKGHLMPGSDFTNFVDSSGRNVIFLDLPNDGTIKDYYLGPNMIFVAGMNTTQDIFFTRDDNGFPVIRVSNAIKEERELKFEGDVNKLFSSAAEVFGGDVLCAVFSGAGDDGVEGARAISEAGGKVIVQDIKPGGHYVDEMPDAVRKAGISCEAVAISDMSEVIIKAAESMNRRLESKRLRMQAVRKYYDYDTGYAQGVDDIFNTSAHVTEYGHFKPTSPAIVEKVCSVIGVEGKSVFSLGSGQGPELAVAVAYGAERAVGVEGNPDLVDENRRINYALSREFGWEELADKIRLHSFDFLSDSLSLRKADLVFYAKNSAFNEGTLERKLINELKDDAIVVLFNTSRSMGETFFNGLEEVSMPGLPESVRLYKKPSQMPVNEIEIEQLIEEQPARIGPLEKIYFAVNNYRFLPQWLKKYIIQYAEEFHFRRKINRLISDIRHSAAVSGYDQADDMLKLIKSTAILVMKAHRGQRRKDGRSYFVHQLGVTGTLMRTFGFHSALHYMVSLLHDTREDQKKGYEWVKGKINRVIEEVPFYKGFDTAKINFQSRMRLGVSMLSKKNLEDYVEKLGPDKVDEIVEEARRLSGIDIDPALVCYAYALVHPHEIWFKENELSGFVYVDYDDAFITHTQRIKLADILYNASDFKYFLNKRVKLTSKLKAFPKKTFSKTLDIYIPLFVEQSENLTREDKVRFYISLRDRLNNHVNLESPRAGPLKSAAQDALTRLDSFLGEKYPDILEQARSHQQNSIHKHTSRFTLKRIFILTFALLGIAAFITALTCSNMPSADITSFKEVAGLLTPAWSAIVFGTMRNSMPEETKDAYKVDEDADGVKLESLQDAEQESLLKRSRKALIGAGAVVAVGIVLSMLGLSPDMLKDVLSNFLTVADGFAYDMAGVCNGFFNAGANIALYMPWESTSEIFSVCSGHGANGRILNMLSAFKKKNRTGKPHPKGDIELPQTQEDFEAEITGNLTQDEADVYSEIESICEELGFKGVRHAELSDCMNSKGEVKHFKTQRSRMAATTTGKQVIIFPRLLKAAVKRGKIKGDKARREFITDIMKHEAGHQSGITFNEIQYKYSEHLKALDGVSKMLNGWFKSDELETNSIAFKMWHDISVARTESRPVEQILDEDYPQLASLASDRFVSADAANKKRMRAHIIKRFKALQGDQLLAWKYRALDKGNIIKGDFTAMFLWKLASEASLDKKELNALIRRMCPRLSEDKKTALLRQIRTWQMYGDPCNLYTDGKDANVTRVTESQANWEAMKDMSEEQRIDTIARRMWTDKYFTAQSAHLSVEEMLDKYYYWFDKTQIKALKARINYYGKDYKKAKKRRKDLTEDDAEQKRDIEKIVPQWRKEQLADYGDDGEVYINEESTVCIEVHNDSDYGKNLTEIEDGGFRFAKGVILAYPQNADNARKSKRKRENYNVVETSEGDIPADAFTGFPVVDGHVNVLLAGRYMGDCVGLAYESILKWQADNKSGVSVSHHFVGDRIKTWIGVFSEQIKELNSDNITEAYYYKLARELNLKAAVYVNGNRIFSDYDDGEKETTRLYFWEASDDFNKGTTQDTADYGEEENTLDSAQLWNNGYTLFEQNGREYAFTLRNNTGTGENTEQWLIDIFDLSNGGKHVGYFDLETYSELFREENTVSEMLEFHKAELGDLRYFVRDISAGGVGSGGFYMSSEYPFSDEFKRFLKERDITLDSENLRTDPRHRQAVFIDEDYRYTSGNRVYGLSDILTASALDVCRRSSDRGQMKLFDVSWRMRRVLSRFGVDVKMGQKDYGLDIAEFFLNGAELVNVSEAGDGFAFTLKESVMTESAVTDYNEGESITSFAELCAVVNATADTLDEEEKARIVEELSLTFGDDDITCIIGSLFCYLTIEGKLSLSESDTKLLFANVYLNEEEQDEESALWLLSLAAQLWSMDREKLWKGALIPEAPENLNAEDVKMIVMADEGMLVITNDGWEKIRGMDALSRELGCEIWGYSVLTNFNGADVLTDFVYPPKENILVVRNGIIARTIINLLGGPYTSKWMLRNGEGSGEKDVVFLNNRAELVLKVNDDIRNLPESLLGEDAGGIGPITGVEKDIDKYWDLIASHTGANTYGHFTMPAMNPNLRICAIHSRHRVLEPSVDDFITDFQPINRMWAGILLEGFVEGEPEIGFFNTEEIDESHIYSDFFGLGATIIRDKKEIEEIVDEVNAVKETSAVTDYNEEDVQSPEQDLELLKKIYDEVGSTDRLLQDDKDWLLDTIDDIYGNAIRYDEKHIMSFTMENGIARFVMEGIDPRKPFDDVNETLRRSLRRLESNGKHGHGFAGLLTNPRAEVCFEHGGSEYKLERTHAVWEVMKAVATGHAKEFLDRHSGFAPFKKIGDSEIEEGCRITIELPLEEPIDVDAPRDLPRERNEVSDGKVVWALNEGSFKSQFDAEDECLFLSQDSVLVTDGKFIVENRSDIHAATCAYVVIRDPHTGIYGICHGSEPDQLVRFIAWMVNRMRNLGADTDTIYWEGIVVGEGGLGRIALANTKAALQALHALKINIVARDVSGDAKHAISYDGDTSVISSELFLNLYERYVDGKEREMRFSSYVPLEAEVDGVAEVSAEQATTDYNELSDEIPVNLDNLSAKGYSLFRQNDHIFAMTLRSGRDRDGVLDSTQYFVDVFDMSELGRHVGHIDFTHSVLGSEKIDIFLIAFALDDGAKFSEEFSAFCENKFSGMGTPHMTQRGGLALRMDSAYRYRNADGSLTGFKCISDMMMTAVLKVAQNIKNGPNIMYIDTLDPESGFRGTLKRLKGDSQGIIEEIDKYGVRIDIERFFKEMPATSVDILKENGATVVKVKDNISADYGEEEIPDYIFAQHTGSRLLSFLESRVGLKGRLRNIQIETDKVYNEKFVNAPETGDREADVVKGVLLPANVFDIALMSEVMGWDENTRILDAGSGLGTILFSARAACGAKVTGSEVDSEVCRESRELQHQLGFADEDINVIEDDFFNISKTDLKDFDVFIYHINGSSDEEEMLRYIADNMRQDAKLIVYKRGLDKDMEVPGLILEETNAAKWLDNNRIAQVFVKGNAGTSFIAPADEREKYLSPYAYLGAIEGYGIHNAEEFLERYPDLVDSRDTEAFKKAVNFIANQSKYFQNNAQNGGYSDCIFLSSRVFQGLRDLKENMQNTDFELYILNSGRYPSKIYNMAYHNFVAARIGGRWFVFDASSKRLTGYDDVDGESLGVTVLPLEYMLKNPEIFWMYTQGTEDLSYVRTSFTEFEWGVMSWHYFVEEVLGEGNSPVIVPGEKLSLDENTADYSDDVRVEEKDGETTFECDVVFGLRDKDTQTANIYIGSKQLQLIFGADAVRNFDFDMEGVMDTSTLQNVSFLHDADRGELIVNADLLEALAKWSTIPAIVGEPNSLKWTMRWTKDSVEFEESDWKSGEVIYTTHFSKRELVDIVKTSSEDRRQLTFMKLVLSVAQNISLKDFYTDEEFLEQVFNKQTGAHSQPDTALTDYNDEDATVKRTVFKRKEFKIGGRHAEPVAMKALQKKIKYLDHGQVLWIATSIIEMEGNAWGRMNDNCIFEIKEIEKSDSGQKRRGVRLVYEDEAAGIEDPNFYFWTAIYRRANWIARGSFFNLFRLEPEKDVYIESFNSRWVFNKNIDWKAVNEVVTKAYSSDLKHKKDIYEAVVKAGAFNAFEQASDASDKTHGTRIVIEMFEKDVADYGDNKEFPDFDEFKIIDMQTVSESGIIKPYRGIYHKESGLTVTQMDRSSKYIYLNLKEFLQQLSQDSELQKRLSIDSELKGAKVLVIGPGEEGYSIMELSEFKGISQLDIIDVLKTDFQNIEFNLADAVKRGEITIDFPVNGHFHNALEFLPKLEGEFDMVFISEVVSPTFSDEQERTLLENIMKYLKKGGLLLSCGSREEFRIKSFKESDLLERLNVADNTEEAQFYIKTAERSADYAEVYEENTADVTQLWEQGYALFKQGEDEFVITLRARTGDSIDFSRDKLKQAADNWLVDIFDLDTGNHVGYADFNKLPTGEVQIKSSAEAMIKEPDEALGFARGGDWPFSKQFYAFMKDSGHTLQEINLRNSDLPAGILLGKRYRLKKQENRLNGVVGLNDLLISIPLYVGAQLGSDTIRIAQVREATKKLIKRLGTTEIIPEYEGVDNNFLSTHSKDINEFLRDGSSAIGVEKKDGVTVFRVKMPVVTDYAEEDEYEFTKLESIKYEQAPDKITILAVDDYAGFTDGIEEHAMEFGNSTGIKFNVIKAADGFEALQIYRERQDEIDYIITDHKMSPGMKGSQLAKAVKVMSPDMPIAMFSDSAVRRFVKQYELEGLLTTKGASKDAYNVLVRLVLAKLDKRSHITCTLPERILHIEAINISEETKDRTISDLGPLVSVFGKEVSEEEVEFWKKQGEYLVELWEYDNGASYRTLTPDETVPELIQWAEYRGRAPTEVAQKVKEMLSYTDYPQDKVKEWGLNICDPAWTVTGYPSQTHQIDIEQDHYYSFHINNTGDDVHFLMHADGSIERVTDVVASVGMVVISEAETADYNEAPVDAEYEDPIFEKYNVLAAFTVDDRKLPANRRNNKVPHPKVVEIPAIDQQLAYRLKRDGHANSRKTFHLMYVRPTPESHRRILTLCNDNALDVLNEQIIYDAISEFGQPDSLVSVHLGESGDGRSIEYNYDKKTITLHDPLPEQEVRKRMITGIEALKKNLKANGLTNEVLLENVCCHPGNVIAPRPDFIRGIAEETDSGLLIDLQHILVSAAGYGMTPLEYLSAIVDSDNIHRLKEVHISVPVRNSSWGGEWGHTLELGEDDVSFYEDTEAAEIVEQLIKYILQLREDTGITSKVVMNFETNDDFAREDVTRLAKVLKDFDAERVADYGGDVTVKGNVFEKKEFKIDEDSAELEIIDSLNQNANYLSPRQIIWTGKVIDEMQRNAKYFLESGCAFEVYEIEKQGIHGRQKGVRLIYEDKTEWSKDPNFHFWVSVYHDFQNTVGRGWFSLLRSQESADVCFRSSDKVWKLKEGLDWRKISLLASNKFAPLLEEDEDVYDDAVASGAFDVFELMEETGEKTEGTEVVIDIWGDHGKDESVADYSDGSAVSEELFSGLITADDVPGDIVITKLRNYREMNYDQKMYFREIADEINSGVCDPDAQCLFKLNIIEKPGAARYIKGVEITFDDIVFNSDIIKMAADPNEVLKYALDIAIGGGFSKLIPKRDTYDTEVEYEVDGTLWRRNKDIDLVTAYNDFNGVNKVFYMSASSDKRDKGRIRVRLWEDESQGGMSIAEPQLMPLPAEDTVVPETDVLVDDFADYGETIEDLIEQALMFDPNESTENEAKLEEVLGKIDDMGWSVIKCKNKGKANASEQINRQIKSIIPPFKKAIFNSNFLSKEQKWFIRKFLDNGIPSKHYSFILHAIENLWQHVKPDFKGVFLFNIDEDEQEVKMIVFDFGDGFKDMYGNNIRIKNAMKWLTSYGEGATKGNGNSWEAWGADLLSVQTNDEVSLGNIEGSSGPYIELFNATLDRKRNNTVKKAYFWNVPEEEKDALRQQVVEKEKARLAQTTDYGENHETEFHEDTSHMTHDTSDNGQTRSTAPTDATDYNETAAEDVSVTFAEAEGMKAKLAVAVETGDEERVEMLLAKIDKVALDASDLMAEFVEFVDALEYKQQEKLARTAVRKNFFVILAILVTIGVRAISGVSIPPEIMISVQAADIFKNRLARKDSNAVESAEIMVGSQIKGALTVAELNGSDYDSGVPQAVPTKVGSLEKTGAVLGDAEFQQLQDEFSDIYLIHENIIAFDINITVSDNDVVFELYSDHEKTGEINMAGLISAALLKELFRGEIDSIYVPKGTRGEVMVDLIRFLNDTPPGELDGTIISGDKANGMPSMQVQLKNRKLSLTATGSAL